MFIDSFDVWIHHWQSALCSLRFLHNVNLHCKEAVLSILEALATISNQFARIPLVDHGEK